MFSERYPLLIAETCFHTNFYDEFWPKKRPILAIFRQRLDKPPKFMENLPKKGPLFREFWPKKPPTWAAHTRTSTCYVPPPPGVEIKSPRKTTLHGLFFYWMILVFVCYIFFLSKNSVFLKCPITTAGTLYMPRPRHRQSVGAARMQIFKSSKYLQAHLKNDLF